MPNVATDNTSAIAGTPSALAAVAKKPTAVINALPIAPPIEPKNPIPVFTIPKNQANTPAQKSLTAATTL